MSNRLKYYIIYLIKAVVLCNGLGSLCASLFVNLVVGRSGGEINPFAVGIIYMGMAFLSAFLAAKGVPDNKTVKWFSVLFPVTVTMICWSLSLVVSGGDMSHGIFNFYSISQITHFYVIDVAQTIGGNWTRFFFPLTFNAVYVAAFGLFSLIPKNRIPFKVKDDGKGDGITIPPLKVLIAAVAAIAAVTAVLCFVMWGVSWQNTAN